MGKSNAKKKKIKDDDDDMLEKNPNYVKVKKERQPPFDYERYPWIDKSKLPWFISSLLNNPHIFDEQKHIVVERFVYQYVHDSAYRKHVQGGYLFFLDRIYQDIYYDFYEMIRLEAQRSKVAIPIFEKHENNNSYITTRIITTETGTKTVTVDHTPLRNPYRRLVR